MPRVLFAVGTAAAAACLTFPAPIAYRILAVYAVGTLAAGCYGQSVLGGVMGDFLGATICVLEVAIHLAIMMDLGRADARAIAWLVGVVSLPQLYGVWRRHGVAPPPAQDC